MDEEMQKKITRLEGALKEMITVVKNNNLSVEDIEILCDLIRKIVKTESRLSVEPGDLALFYTKTDTGLHLGYTTELR